MLRIMFIDDNAESVVDAAELLGKNLEGLQQCTMNFEEGRESIRSFRPDIIVLDIWKGRPQNSDPAGSNVLSELWNEQFCPVIVYSADSEVIKQVSEYEHPLVPIITKGSGSDEKVLEAVTSP